VRAFVTGATGFIGARVARRLRERGDEVVALVRSPAKAADLADLGCELVEGGLLDAEAIRAGLEGADACFHIAGDYRVGMTAEGCKDMWKTNVDGTRSVLEAAHDAGVAKTVYVSTVGIFGNTEAQVVDETFRRDESKGFLTCYDETKYRAHQVAEELIERGDPIVIAAPGGVYGPGDHSGLGTLIEMTRKGRAKLLPFADLGWTMAHVEDVAEGIVLAHDRGRPGELYVLAGPAVRNMDVANKVAELTGRRPPRGKLPTAFVRAAIPFGRVMGRALGTEPNLREMIRGSEGVTYWAKADKARAELGWEPRDMETGLRDTLAGR
jgi:dihydroflavonol-4-reductase